MERRTTNGRTLRRCTTETPSPSTASGTTSTGPSHRFIIKRFDQVEVFFSAQRTEVGEVVGISHANEQVCVRFPGADDGVWFSKGQIYPAVESKPERRHKRSAAF